MKSTYLLVLHLTDRLLDCSEHIAKPRTLELLLSAGNYVIASVEQ